MLWKQQLLFVYFPPSKGCLVCRYLLFTEFNASRILCLLGIIKHSFVHIIQCPDSEKKTTDHEKWLKCLKKLNAFSALTDCVCRPRSRFWTKYSRFTTRALYKILLCTKYSNYSKYSFVQNIQNIALYKILAFYNPCFNFYCHQSVLVVLVQPSSPSNL